MSYQVFFALSTGFSAPQRVPKGTLKRIWERIEAAERLLGLKRTPTFTPEGESKRPGWYWHAPGKDMLDHAGPEIDRSLARWWLLDRERDNLKAAMGRAVLEHNYFVRALYNDFAAWQKRKWKRGESEKISPAESVEFWGGLQTLELPKDLWDRAYFGDYMEHLHELLTKGESRGTHLHCKSLSPEQVGALILLLEAEIDQWGFDARFEVPLDANLKPLDRIKAADDGGYDWCSHCGAIDADEFHERCRICPRAKKGKCDLKNSHPAEFEN